MSYFIYADLISSLPDPRLVNYFLSIPDTAHELSCPLLLPV